MNRREILSWAGVLTAAAIVPVATKPAEKKPDPNCYECFGTGRADHQGRPQIHTYNGEPMYSFSFVQIPCPSCLGGAK